MRAAIVESVDGPFHIVERPRPVPTHGQALVRVHASAINPLDTKIRAGSAAHARHPLPAILGIDLAGVVEQLGPGVAGFQVGDAVFGMTGGVGGVPGSLADYAAVDAALLAVKPERLSMREAAALPLAVITAWEGLVDRAHVGAADTVLVHGGAGGVGRAAIQIARSFGATVFATHLGNGADVINALGATPIDTRAATVEDYVAAHTAGRGFDLVYDTVGGAVLDASFAAIRRFGHVVSCLGWGSHALAPLSFKAATYSGVFTLLPLLTGEGRAHHGEILAAAAKMVEAGQLTARLDPRQFGLDSVGEAHDALTTGKAAGKLVVSIV